MAKTYQQILNQIGALQREADKIRAAEVKGVVARIREAIEAYGLTAADLGLMGGRGVRSAKGGGSNPTSAGAKYQDSQGNIWGGRGPRPAWLREALAAGRSLEEFLVGGQTAASHEKPASKRTAKAARSAASNAPKAAAKKSTRARRASKAAQAPSLSAEQEASEQPVKE